MKRYCMQEDCLRAALLHHFGFPLEKQDNCCSNCGEKSKISTEFILKTEKENSALLQFTGTPFFWLNMIDLFMLINNHSTTYT